MKRAPAQKAPVKVISKRVNPVMKGQYSTLEVNSTQQQRSHSAPKKRTSLKQNLMSDYGVDIHAYLKKLEAGINQASFLGKH
jgi:hypothetical protein